MLKILIIDSNPKAQNDAFIANRGAAQGDTYAAALNQCRDDLNITIVAPYDGEALPQLDQFDGVVFTGSSVPWNTSDTRAEPIAAVMRSVFAKGLPTLGSVSYTHLTLPTKRRV